MATAEEYAAWIVKNADKKGTPEFDTVAKAYSASRAAPSREDRVAALMKSNPGEYDPASPEWNEKYGATSGMNFGQKLVAGYGKAVPDIVRGVGQKIGQGIDAIAPAQTSITGLVTGQKAPTLSSRMGLPQQSDIDEMKRLDAPLMNTGAGMVGNVLGNVATLLPAAAVPGAATVPGAALIGAASGAIQPTGTGESAVANAALGGALGGGSVVAGRLAGAAWRGAKALYEPFTEGGAQRIAGRTIQRFASDPSRINQLSNQPTITGALPTLAEQTGDVGLARLQDALRSADPQLNNALAARASTNNAARVNALQSMTGQDGARDFAAAHRAATAQQQYERAFSVPVKAEDLSPAMRGEATKLMRLPAVQDAVKEAKRNAANFGMNLTEDNSIAGMHQAKLAMDDAISRLSSGGPVEANKAAGIKAARDRLVTFMEKMSPDYQEARTTYAEMSRPVNQMDIAAQVAKRGLSNGTDLATGAPTINRNALLNAMKDEPALIRQATGRSAGKSLADVMEPEQLNMLRAIAAESDRAGAVATAGNGPGSATAQRLASQNILRQVMAPNAGGASPTLAQKAGQAVAENTLANTVVGKATNWLYSGIAEPKIQQALLKATLSPEEATAALAAAKQQGLTLPDNVYTRLVGQARRVMGVSAAKARQP